MATATDTLPVLPAKLWGKVRFTAPPASQPSLHAIGASAVAALTAASLAAYGAPNASELTLRWATVGCLAVLALLSGLSALWGL